MDVERPAPGEELNSEAQPTPPRDAATVILLRPGAAGLEVLLVKRNPAQRFMGGAWVFPGGAVDAGDAEGDQPHRVAAVREVAEEAGIALPGPQALVPFSRWITPAQIKIRFDTLFYLAELPDGEEASADGDECVDARWFAPRDALSAYEREEIQLVFPTIKTLEQLAAHASPADAIAAARASDLQPVEPRVRVEGDRARLLLPGEPGYEDA
jgi:8-oxo-dGTP pyrophosphatase MutT (NUDIX family)